MELTQEARAARALRDELDILRERANKVHLLESERESYKDKMSQMESLKCRIDEVREENKILVEVRFRKKLLAWKISVSRKNRVNTRKFGRFAIEWYYLRSFKLILKNFKSAPAGKVQNA